MDASTPFVYVPRPLIVEEHGLRRLMEESGVGVLLPQTEYEMGNWAGKIEEAYEKGKSTKAAKRKSGWDDVRKREADAMARDLDCWVSEWWDKVESGVEMADKEEKNVDAQKSGLGLSGIATLGFAVEPISV